MSISVNKVIIQGNLGSDPEIKKLKSGEGEFAVLSVATNDSYKNKDEEKVDLVEWHQVIIFRPALVELVKSYLQKGDQVYIEGSIATKKIEKEGQKPQYRTQIEVKNFDHVFKFDSKKSKESKPQ